MTDTDDGVMTPEASAKIAHLPDNTRTMMEQTARLFAALAYSADLPAVQSFNIDPTRMDPGTQIRIRPGSNYTITTAYKIAQYAARFGESVRIHLSSTHEVATMVAMPLNTLGDTITLEVAAYLYSDMPQLLAWLVRDHRDRQVSGEQAEADPARCPHCSGPLIATSTDGCRPHIPDSGTLEVPGTELVAVWEDGRDEYRRRVPKDQRERVSDSAALLSGRRIDLLAALFWGVRD